MAIAARPSGRLAVLTGGQAIFKDLGIDLESVKLTDLGRAKKVKITSDDTVIVGGGAARSRTSKAAPNRSAARSTRPTASMIARSCKSVWPSWPAAWLRSTAVPRPKPK